MEALQGEGGIRPGDMAFFKGIREICDRTGAVMIVDEVQTHTHLPLSTVSYNLNNTDSHCNTHHIALTALTCLLCLFDILCVVTGADRHGAHGQDVGLPESTRQAASSLGHPNTNLNLT